MKFKRALTESERSNLLDILKARFLANKVRHEGAEWAQVEQKLQKPPMQDKLVTLYMMEETGGKPDVTGFDERTGEYIFADCSKESPAGRRSLCYDREAWEARKKHKPEGNAVDSAAVMGIELMTEEQYREFQRFGPFDTTTSSWLQTPEEVRKMGGAIFGDYRYGCVFIYHNGAESYYAGRGFRGVLRL